MLIKILFMLLQTGSAWAHIPMGMNVIIDIEGAEPVTYTTMEEENFVDVDYIAGLGQTNACVAEMMQVYINGDEYKPILEFLKSQNVEWVNGPAYTNDFEYLSPNYMHLNVHLKYNRTTGQYSSGDFSVFYDGAVKFNTFNQEENTGCDISKILGDVALEIYDQNAKEGI